MAVSFELPSEIERNLRQTLGNLDEAAKEAALVGLYRQRKLTQRELAQALGLTRLETESLLKKHGVTEDLPTADEIERDVEDLRRLLERR
jgi:hypothetical protein